MFRELNWLQYATVANIHIMVIVMFKNRDSDMQIGVADTA